MNKYNYKNIIVTGYNGSGSTALCNLLKEYSGAGFVQREGYEHNFLHLPNSVFDLEYKLTKMNNHLRSDEAINEFKSILKKIYSNDFNWFGGYQNILGDDFIKISNDYIESLIDFNIYGYWANDIIKNIFSLNKAIKDLVKLVLGKEITIFGKTTLISKDRTISISYPSFESFLIKTKKFISSYLNLFENKSENNFFLFDHLLLPNHTEEFIKFFPENTKLIIVERDIRDLYIYGKYIRRKNGNFSKYPTTELEFLDFWNKIRSIEKSINNKNILRVSLDNLIYDHDNTVNIIEKFLEFNSSDRIFKNKYFNIEIARENSRLYENNKYKSDVQIIKSWLKNNE